MALTAHPMTRESSIKQQFKKNFSCLKFDQNAIKITPSNFDADIKLKTLKSLWFPILLIILTISILGLMKYHQHPQMVSQLYSEQSSTCIFCRIARQEQKADIVAKFKHCYAMKDAYPVSNGHILIIPYEHTENWFTAREEVRLDIMEAMHKIKENLVEKRRRSKKTSQQSFSMPFSTVLLSLCDVKNR
jgi:hypothetical protein